MGAVQAWRYAAMMRARPARYARADRTRSGIASLESPAPIGAIRCEHVGSLLRPPELLVARERHRIGELSHADFKWIEDRAVDAAVRLQEEIGLDVITDGEFRRRGWMSHFHESVSGFRAGAGPLLPWRDHQQRPLPEALRARTRPVVVEKLRWHRSACAEEWSYLRGTTALPKKATLISAATTASMYEPRLSRAAYSTRDAYFEDVVALLRREVEELVRLGCQYIQLDAPQYGSLVDPGNRELFRRHDNDPDAIIDAGVAMDNAIVDGFGGVTFGLHICRGNNRSRFFAAGDYRPLQRIFDRARFDRFLLEFDDARSGGFEPLAAIPEDRTVVLGLVTTKHHGLESDDELKRRIEHASHYFPLENLALSPQCGFASMMEGNEITAADQRRKLELVRRVSRSVWG